MRFFGIIDEEGDVIESGFAPDNCGITTALGREVKKGERYITGQGQDELSAMEASHMTYPVEV